MSKHNHDQGTMLTPAVYDREAILSPDEQFTTMQHGSRPEEADLLVRSTHLITSLGKLAEAGKLGGADKSRYLSSSSPQPDDFEDRYGDEGAPRVRTRAANKKPRLEAEAKIYLAGAAGYITLKEMNDLLGFYKRPKNVSAKEKKEWKPPKEPPFPETIKKEVDTEFRSFSQLYGVPERENIRSDDVHKANVKLHADRRAAYRRQLRATQDRIRHKN